LSPTETEQGGKALKLERLAFLIGGSGLIVGFLLGLLVR
jgi:hypothetical protein